MSGIALVAGLANPGQGYATTRHNAGSWFLDYLSGRYLLLFREENRFRGRTAMADISGHRVRFLRPATFMNESGLPVADYARYFDILPENILVVHDELDLPPGSVLLKHGGGAGGHNGLRDVISHLGSKDFWRLRLGIGHPGEAAAVVDYVLRTPPPTERDAIVEATARAGTFFDDLVAGDYERVMNELHRADPLGAV